MKSSIPSAGPENVAAEERGVALLGPDRELV
jgi:hypothetical protein